MAMVSCSGIQLVPQGQTPLKKAKQVVEVGEQSPPHSFSPEQLQRYCHQTLEQLPGVPQPPELLKACSQVALREGCVSHQNRPIFHYDKEAMGEKGKPPLKILAIALVHGDEFPAGSVARSWMERLGHIDPRSTWRVIPVANPDGLVAKTRTNGQGVDINRNFPTKKWRQLAIAMWRERYQSSWRKYPGPAPASEPETRCLMGHIQDFSPDFIISLHTPLGHLDFDGPKMQYPSYNLLPWRRFGHFPGSLGRYMWRDHGVPVLTIELKGNSPVRDLKALDNLQDISGTLALRAGR